MLSEAGRAGYAAYKLAIAAVRGESLRQKPANHTCQHIAGSGCRQGRLRSHRQKVHFSLWGGDDGVGAFQNDNSLVFLGEVEGGFQRDRA